MEIENTAEPSGLELELEAIRDAQVAHSTQCDADRNNFAERFSRIDGKLDVVIDLVQSATLRDGTQNARLSAIETAKSAGKSSGAISGGAIGGLVTLLGALAQHFLGGGK